MKYLAGSVGGKLLEFGVEPRAFQRREHHVLRGIRHHRTGLYAVVLHDVPRVLLRHLARVLSGHGVKQRSRHQMLVSRRQQRD